MITAEAICRYGSVASVLKRLPKYRPASPITHTMAVCETVAASPSSTACASVPRTAMMNAAIIVLECPGSSPCRAPSSMALGMNSQEFPCCSSVLKLVMAPGTAIGWGV